MPLLHSYSPNYYCLEDILATQERIPCKFLTTIPKLGKLNSASEDEDLAAGTALELPLWLTQALTSGRQVIISTELPRIFTEPYREILKADPCAVNLYKWNLNFYEFGFYAKNLDQRRDVANILIYTFITRFKKLMDLADNVGTDPTVESNLDVLERSLFRDGHNARMKLNTWLMESQIQLEASSMVTNHKKRKHINLTE